MQPRRGPQRTQYVPPSPYLHPYANYPYAPRAHVDPRYVGPQWAAPAPRPVVAPPHAPRTPRKTGRVWPLILLLVTVIATAPLVLAVAARNLFDEGTAVERPRPPPTPASTVAVPTATVAPPTAVTQPDLTKQLKTGTCREVSRERNEDQYQASRDAGSAKRLRGKVAMLHIQLGGGQAAWPKPLTTRIDEAALLSQRFYLEQAKRHHITDVTYDIIPWPLREAKVQLPTLPTNSAKLLDNATMFRLRDESQLAIEQAFGSSLDSVVASYRRNGYTSVGFLVYLPVTTDARDFAFPASKFDHSDRPEIGILFPRVDVLDHLSVVVAHEGMHLFGADDLYRMRNADAADVHDVMGEYCLGFRQTSVDDTTAYAIGWRDRPPSRSYAIVDR